MNIPIRLNSFFILGLALFIATPAVKAQRESFNLATGWKFLKRDADWNASTAAWEAVSVPHTWNAQDGQLGKIRNPGVKDGYYRGPAWYALPLDIPASWKGKRVFIRFEAAALVSKTYINGTYLGEHRGGFTAFCYELTPYLNFGGANELRVRVDNSRQDDVAPLGGDFNIDGGLYRPVHLIVTAPVCITPLDFASPGVYLTQKSVAQHSATIEVRTLISNGNDSRTRVKVKTEIDDEDGKLVASQDRTVTVPAGMTEPVLQTVKLRRPHLWQGRKDPYLYSVTIRVNSAGQNSDEVRQPLGLRTVQITEANGFLLNGKPYPIYGVDRHQDRRDEGWALSPADHEEDARMILDMGATAIRLAHYPQSEYFHSLCDRNGLLLWNEIPLVDRINDTPAFSANAEQQLREMILQRYNHPSCVFWGLFNELRKSPSPDALLTHLQGVIHELDPTRIDVGASDQRNATFNHIPTGICFNVYPGWYEKNQPEDIAADINDRFKEVGKRIGLSEYGAGANPFQHEEGSPKKVPTTGQFHPEEWQTYVHEREWRVIRNNPKLWGSFIWVMFDMPSANRNEGGQPGLNDKGLVTEDRKIKKDAYYFYKANWNPEPMVYIASRRSTPRKLATTAVEVFSNCGAVELKVNGQSVGTARPDDINVARWENVHLRPGTNRIEAAGFFGKQQIGDACEWVLR